jgi:hypothetical protein
MSQSFPTLPCLIHLCPLRPWCNTGSKSKRSRSLTHMIGLSDRDRTTKSAGEEPDYSFEEFNEPEEGSTSAIYHDYSYREYCFFSVSWEFFFSRSFPMHFCNNSQVQGPYSWRQKRLLDWLLYRMYHPMRYQWYSDWCVRPFFEQTVLDVQDFVAFRCFLQQSIKIISICRVYHIIKSMPIKWTLKFWIQQLKVAHPALYL